METIPDLLQQARGAYASQDFVRARERCESILQKDAEEIEALELLGLTALSENRVTDGIEHLTKVTELAPERAAAFYALGAAYLTAGKTRNALRRLETAAQLNPNDKQVSSLLERAKAQHRRRVPSFHMNTLPKSGSMFIWANLAQRLAVDRLQVSCTFFPDDMIILRNIRHMAENGYISLSHLPANSLNKRILRHYFKRIIVHVRDPRQATLSWAHHVDKYCMMNVEEIQYVTPPLPADFPDLSFEERLTWQIKNHLPLCVQWIEDWLDAGEDPDFTTEILFTRYEDFRKDADAYFTEVLNFFDIPHDAFDRETQTEEKPHFRKGQADEWREVFTPEQAARATEMMTDRILERFGWER